MEHPAAIYHVVSRANGKGNIMETDVGGRILSRCWRRGGTVFSVSSFGAATGKRALSTSHAVGRLGRAACARVFREGAENCTRGGCAPRAWTSSTDRRSQRRRYKDPCTKGHWPPSGRWVRAMRLEGLDAPLARVFSARARKTAPGAGALPGHWPSAQIGAHRDAATRTLAPKGHWPPSGRWVRAMRLEGLGAPLAPVFSARRGKLHPGRVRSPGIGLQHRSALTETPLQGPLHQRALASKRALGTSHAIGRLGSAACARVFREGAENCIRGGCAPRTVAFSTDRRSQRRRYKDPCTKGHWPPSGRWVRAMRLEGLGASLARVFSARARKTAPGAGALPGQ
jgi:hypothetical protein